MSERRRYPFRAQSTCRSIVDRGVTRDREGNRYASVVVILRPWRRNQWGEYLAQRALVVGWREAPSSPTHASPEGTP